MCSSGRPTRIPIASDLWWNGTVLNATWYVKGDIRYNEHITAASSAAFTCKAGWNFSKLKNTKKQAITISMATGQHGTEKSHFPEVATAFTNVKLSFVLAIPVQLNISWNNHHKMNKLWKQNIRKALINRRRCWRIGNAANTLWPAEISQYTHTWCILINHVSRDSGRIRTTIRYGLTLRLTRVFVSKAADSQETPLLTPILYRVGLRVYPLAACGTCII